MKIFFSTLLLFLFVSSLAQKELKVFKEEGKYGIKRFDEVVVPANFDDAKTIEGCDGVYYAVKKENKWALWIGDHQATEFLFDDIIRWNDYFKSDITSTAYAIVKEDKQYGVIQISNCKSAPYVIPPKYASIKIIKPYEYLEGVLFQCQRLNVNFEYYKADENLYTFDFLLFINGATDLQFLNNEEESWLMIYKKQNKYGISSDNEILLKNIYDSIEPVEFLHKGKSYFSYFLILHKDGMKNFSSFTYGYNNPLLPNDVEDLILGTFDIDHLPYLAIKRENKWSVHYYFMDHYETDTIFEHKTEDPGLHFDSVAFIYDDYFWVQLNGKWATYGQDGFLSDFTYRKPQNPKKWNRAYSRKKHQSYALNKYQVIDTLDYKSIKNDDNKYGFERYYQFAPPIYDKCIPIKNRGFIVKMNNTFGYRSGNYHSPIIYDTIYHLPQLDSNLLCAQIGTQYTYMNAQKFIHSQLLYDSITYNGGSYMITYLNSKSGLLAKGNRNVKPIYDRVETPNQNISNALLWDKDSFRVLTQMYYLSEDRYHQWVPCPKSELNIFYIQNAEGWFLCDKQKIHPSAYKSITELENNTWRRFYKWKDSIPSNQIDSLGNDMWVLHSDQGKQLVYASKHLSVLSNEWKFTITNEPIDTFFQIKGYNDFIIKKENLYGISGQFLSNDDPSYLIQYTEVKQDTASNTFILTNKDGKVALFNPRYKYIDMVLYDSIQAVDPVTGLWKTFLNGKEGLVLLDKRRTGTTYQIEAKHDQIHFIRFVSDYGNEFLYAFKENEKWGVELARYPDDNYIFEDPKHSSLEDAIKAIKGRNR